MELKLIECNRYFETIEHPVFGDGIFIKIGAEFESQEKADKFKNQELSWEDGVIVTEITEEEYLKATEEYTCEDCKYFLYDGNNHDNYYCNYHEAYIEDLEVCESYNE